MKININENYRIETDALNVTLFESYIGEKTGEKKYKVAGYYPNLHSALQGCINHGLMASDLISFAEVVLDMNIAFKQIETMCKSLEGENG